MATGTIRTPDYLVNTSFAANTTGQIGADDAQDGAETFGALPFSSASPIAGAGYTAVMGDRGALLEFTSSSAITLTIPTNASVAFPVGSLLHIRQAGTGQVTIAGSGVTFDTATGTQTTRAQWSRVSLHKRATNEWVLEGDLS
jgi:hypothetical protein